MTNKLRLALLICLIAGRPPARGSAPGQEGDPVDLSAWAYAYRKGATDNPPETQWLAPHKMIRRDIINGSLVWYYDDSADVLPKGVILGGLLWEEPRPVQTVTVEFPASPGHIPKVGEILVAARSAASLWEDSQRKPSYSAVVAEEQGHPVISPQGTTIFRFNLVCDPFTKLYVIYNGGDGAVAIPRIHAYASARWARESSIDVQGVVGPDGSAKGWDGRVEAYNGVIDRVEPLASGNGAPQGVRIRLFQTDDPGNSRTLLSLRMEDRSFSVALRDLEEGPVFVPEAGIFIQKTGGADAPADFIRRLKGKGLETARARAEAEPEESWASAMQRYHGTQILPEFPRAPFEPPMQIDVPEAQLVSQWRLGAWHLKRWCQKLQDGTYAVSIWPYNKSIGGNEGTVALGSESFLNIETLDMLGLPDVAQGGLDYWLFGAHALPFLWNAEVMGDDALINPYNSPNHQSPGYDQKHSLGHGRVMAAAAFHYRITRDQEWWQKAAPVLQRAGAATVRLRDSWNRTQPAGTWSHGLIPPGYISDNNNSRLFYAVSGYYYQGLHDVAALPASPGAAAAPNEVQSAEAFRRDLREAVDRSVALTQVVKVADGTYRRDFPFMPYIRGLAFDIDNGPVAKSSLYYDAKMGALALVEAGVIDPNEPIVSELLDVFEDRLARDGQNAQNGYNPAPEIYLSLDDIPMFLRGMYNGYAAEVDPTAGYTFAEGANASKLDSPDKTFEEARFLRNVRLMLVMEDGDSLWLARGAPRAWLGQGKRIAVSHAPTFFGEVSYSIMSDVSSGRIEAAIDLPPGRPPQAVFLKLRHPAGTRIRAVLVNGRPWTDFDPARELITLKGLTGRVTVTASF